MTNSSPTVSVPPGMIRARLHWRDHADGERRFAVEVTSSWDQPIAEFFPATAAYYPAGRQPRPGAFPVSIEITAQSENMFFAVGEFDGTLAPGQTTLFELDSMVLPVLRDRVAALSPENYWIAFVTCGEEFDRMAGSDIAAVLDQDGGG